MDPDQNVTSDQFATHSAFSDTSKIVKQSLWNITEIRCLNILGKRGTLHILGQGVRSTMQN